MSEQARTVIVTGSETGIGAATAVAFANAGYDVGVTWFSSESDGREIADEVDRAGRRAVLRRLDVSDLEHAGDAVDAFAQELGGLDVFVNNAGVMSNTPFLETTLEDWRRQLTTDLDGAFVCAQRAAKRMVAQGRGGRIINVTSVHQLVPLRGASAYAASKGALGQLTKVMALELAEHGITVNNVAPGEIATGMNKADDVDPYATERPYIPVGRPGDAWEVARVVVHLADPETTYTTGSTYVVDGGLLLMAAIANQDAPRG
jgi:NAD(P)-dependent dehydrogenase (short-subunit alcohol dehydrogenase family)